MRPRSESFDINTSSYKKKSHNENILRSRSRSNTAPLLRAAYVSNDATRTEHSPGDKIFTEDEILLLKNQGMGWFNNGTVTPTCNMLTNM